MRKTDDQKQAAYEQRIAMLRAKVRRIEQRKTQQERRDRIHVGMTIGWGLIEHALSNPKSEVRRVTIKVIKTHLAERPDDRAMTELLGRINEAPVAVSAVAAAQEEAAE